jgi:adenine phosphoribosyltransferase
MLDLKEHIRAVPDFPKAGIMFRDIQPLLAHPQAFAETIDQLCAPWQGMVDVVVGLDARGFLLAAPMAIKLGLPLVMVRKKGKLPGATASIEYDLEYGHATVEIGLGLIEPGAQVLVVDDLLATGGTAEAACRLVEKCGGTVVGCAFVIELVGLGGEEKLAQYPVKALVKYE